MQSSIKVSKHFSSSVQTKRLQRVRLYGLLLNFCSKIFWAKLFLVTNIFTMKLTRCFTVLIIKHKTYAKAILPSSFWTLLYHCRCIMRSVELELPLSFTGIMISSDFTLWLFDSWRVLFRASCWCIWCATSG